MKTLTEYVENKETEKIFNEGAGDTIAKVIGNILGFGSVGVLSAWAAALLFRGGAGVVNHIAKTLGKDGIAFKAGVKEDKNSKAVKNELIKMNSLKNKYEKELESVLANIKIKSWDAASEAFKELPKEQQNSTEIRKVVIEEITKVCQDIPISEPTPGNECYRAIRKITDMATAKAVSKAMMLQVQNYINSEE